MIKNKFLIKLIVAILTVTAPLDPLPRYTRKVRL